MKIRRKLWAALGLALLVMGRSPAAELDLTPYVARIAAEPPSDEVSKVMDGISLTKAGWNVWPQVEIPATLEMALSLPLEVAAVEFELSFLSGEPGNFCGDVGFAVQTAGSSQWQDLKIMDASSVGPAIAIIRGTRVQTKPELDHRPDAILTVRCEAPHAVITALRLSFQPVLGGHTPKLRLGWMWNGNFCLTECRIKALFRPTDNVALGGQVHCSYIPAESFAVSNLTDGLPASLCMPHWSLDEKDHLYEVDLGQLRKLNHVRLRRHGGEDERWPGSQTEVTLAAESGGPALWSLQFSKVEQRFEASSNAFLELAPEARSRAGRYLQVINHSAGAPAHGLSEIEAYEATPLDLAQALVDGQALDLQALTVPAGYHQLSLQWQLQGRILDPSGKLQWKFQEAGAVWQLLPIRSAAMLGKLDPGHYQVSACWIHSDGQPDRLLQTTNLQVLPHFWQTIWWKALVVLLSAGLLSALFALGRAAERKKVRAAQEMERLLSAERSRISMDMHDEVGARLSQLGLLQDLLQPDPQLAPAGWQRLREHTREAIRSLDAVIWSINPGYDTLTNTADYLAHMTCEYLADCGLRVEVLLPNDWPARRLSATVRHHLAMASREILQNIVKHAQATSVRLTGTLTEEALSISFADNGRGFHLPQAPDQPGEGLKNIAHRMAKIGGTAHFETLISHGSTVCLQIPATAILPP